MDVQLPMTKLVRRCANQSALSLTPCFSKVIEPRRPSSTVLTVSGMVTVQAERGCPQPQQLRTCQTAAMGERIRCGWGQPRSAPNRRKTVKTVSQPFCRPSITQLKLGVNETGLRSLPFATHRPCRRAAFTLLELLIVLAIIGFLSAMALPHIGGLTRSNVMAGANEQLLGDLALARQRAINGRSAVYMVFMPTNDPTVLKTFLSTTQVNQTLAWQYTGYTLFADRSVGDQPGRPFKRYLTGWKSLPDGVFIATYKFFNPYYSNVYNGVLKQVLEFDYGDFPYPTSDSPNSLTFPYIKFDAQGRIDSPTIKAHTGVDNCIIPLARGSILLYTDPNTGILQPYPPVEKPANNSTDTNTFNHIEIDAATGRAHLDRRTL